jgi:predicted DNA-binding transcriptional regulator AlpA
VSTNNPEAFSHTSRGPLLRTKQAAAYLGLSKGVIDRWRLQGIGPRWSRLGKKIVVYSIEDLDAFLDEGKSPPPKSR